MSLSIGTFARTSAKSIDRGSIALTNARHIELRSVPHSAKPSDIRRSINRAGLQGISDVAVDYSRYRPTGRALITLTDPDYLRDNLSLLERFTIAGTHVSAEPILLEENRPRRRGVKGRAQAAERGILSGNGPHADLSQDVGKTIVIWGFPGKMSAEVAASYFNDFKVARSNEVPRVEHVPLPTGEFSMYSRFAVTLKSVSEAHRFVRHFHLTHFKPEAFGTKHLLHARVVY